MTRAFSAALILGTLLTAPAVAQVALVNKPNYEPGHSSRTTSQIKTRQVLTLAGKNLESQNEQYMVLVETPGPLNQDGTRPVKYSFDTLRIGLTSPGITLKFDSAQPDKPNELPQLDQVLDLFRRLAKARWTATFGRDNLIKSIEYEGKPFADLDPELQKEVDPEKDAQTANDILRRLPNKVVQPNETWQRTERFNPGSGQMMEFVREFKYLGPKQVEGRTLQEIEVKTTGVKYLALGDQAPLKVAGSDLKVEASKGTILYDQELGVMTRSTEQTRVNGAITFLVEGTEVQGQLDLTIDSDTTFACQR